MAAQSTAARLLRLWVRIPPETWMYVCCECCVLSGIGLCDELITRPEESYRLWFVVVCDLEKTSLVNEEEGQEPLRGYRAKKKVVIVIRLRTGQCGVRIPAGTKEFSLFKNVHTGSGANSAYLHWLQRFFHGGKAIRTEANHSPPSSAESKIEWRLRLHGIDREKKSVS